MPHAILFTTVYLPLLVCANYRYGMIQYALLCWHHTICITVLGSSQHRQETWCFNCWIQSKLWPVVLLHVRPIDPFLWMLNFFFFFGLLESCKYCSCIVILSSAFFIDKTKFIFPFAIPLWTSYILFCRRRPVWSRIWGHEAQYIQHCKNLDFLHFQSKKLCIPQICVSSL